MSASMNSVVLIGRTTKDPDLRKTSSGISYCRFTVACDRPKTQEDKEPGADFISCVAWRGQADFMGNYVKKGNLIAVQGMIQTGSYKDREGRTVYTTDVLVRNVQALESKRERGSAYDYPRNGTSVSRDDISREINNQGFDTGDTQIDIDTDDLPF